MAKIAVIGGGFSGLSAAAYLAKAGHQVDLFEKNDSPGGRARQFETTNGYLFDMGPSWYWMPEVIEGFFNDLNARTIDFFTLTRLDPAFEMIFPESQTLRIPDNFEELCRVFETRERGAAQQLRRFMIDARYKYEVGISQLSRMPGLSVFEFADSTLIKGMFRLHLFSSFHKHVLKYFRHPHLVALMEFPVLFLGAPAPEMPALYSLMNYAGLKLGTWYPQGGFGKVVNSIVDLCQGLGVRIHLHAPVEKINVRNSSAYSVTVHGKEQSCDAVVATADYHYVEQRLLPPSLRNYSDRYWRTRVMAPSCLIYFLGIRKKIGRLEHHTLFFDNDLAVHSQEIYKTPAWPTDPLFYVCCPSRTDQTVAPSGHENLFLLMPLAPGLKDEHKQRELYLEKMMDRLEKHAGEDIRSYIDYKQSYCLNDFESDYHAFRGNAYGLANTLKQTAVLKPAIRNKKVRNLFYAGQLTVPGPGVPPSLISGKIVANQLIKTLKLSPDEIPV